MNREINPAEKKGHRFTKLWVVVVLTIGIVMGILLSLLAQAKEFWFGFGPFHFEIEPILTFYIVLSTISLAMLVSLLIVYARVYKETRANFALGLLIVLFALLLHSLLSNPVLLILLAPIPFGFRPFLSIADIFTVVAYTVFLYLSLE